MKICKLLGHQYGPAFIKHTPTGIKPAQQCEKCGYVNEDLTAHIPRWFWILFVIVDVALISIIYLKFWGV